MKYRINYEAVMSQANQITEQSELLAAQIRQLSQIEADCRCVWKGEGAEAFLTRLALLRQEMGRTRAQMSDLAETVKYCADKIQREDEQLRRRAGELNA